MSNVLIMLIENIKSSIRDALSSAMMDGKILSCDIPEVNVEIPADRNNGDLSSNIALASAKIFKTSPLSIAELIHSNLKSLSTLVDKTEIAGPGFINFFLGQEFYKEVLCEIDYLGSRFGRSNIGSNKKVMVEFVSANPTGPMHMGNARGGALGDCLASVLEAAGYNVWREFYVNDAGNQIEKFGKSLDARYNQIWKGDDAVPFPEDGYHGEDIKELAREFSSKYRDSIMNQSESQRRQELVNFALPKNIRKMHDDMDRYKIHFDKWFNESELYRKDEVQDTIDILTKRGYTYECDGALWYRATLFGSEKDEVLIRNNGIPTYFAADIAYHRNKLQLRDFDFCIDIWGADHHGHVARMKGAMAALGIEPDRLDILLVQLVRLLKDGEVVKMSKRTGKAIQLSDLLDEVDTDAARFIFNMYEANSSMDFDLDLAVKKDSENPVYYVQYAYARICSIFRSCDKELLDNIKHKKVDLTLLDTKEEKDLIFFMSTLAGEIIKSAKTYDPTKLTRYVIHLATLFHKFYTVNKVIVDDPLLMYARLLLCKCVQTVIKNILDMFKITTPEKM